LLADAADVIAGGLARAKRQAVDLPAANYLPMQPALF
jgi:hypothetical protein